VLHRVCVPLSFFACSVACDDIASVSVGWSPSACVSHTTVAQHSAQFQLQEESDYVPHSTQGHCCISLLSVKPNAAFISFCSFRDIRDDEVFIKLYKLALGYLIFVGDMADLP
jgi:hypothetical protein